ncbi:hypothetical protein J6590_089226 [Homalodisca vitripennis]|nr:hypothetical protein J6590_089226 [Homalodisca vitripennis]
MKLVAIYSNNMCPVSRETRGTRKLADKAREVCSVRSWAATKVGPPHGIKQITMFIRENVECLDSSFTTTTTIKLIYNELSKQPDGSSDVRILGLRPVLQSGFDYTPSRESVGLKDCQKTRCLIQSDVADFYIETFTYFAPYASTCILVRNTILSIVRPHETACGAVWKGI